MENNADTQVVEEKVEQETTQKTYTEQDIQNSFNAGVKKASTEWQKDEKYKEFLDWKKSNQNDSEKITELQNQINTLTQDNSKKDEEIFSLKSYNAVSNTDVKKEFCEFVTDKVMKLVNETTNFDTALKKYKSENPQYFGETIVKKVQSSPNLNGGGNKETTTNSIMNDILRGSRK